MAITFNKKQEIIKYIKLESSLTLNSAVIDNTNISSAKMNKIRKEIRDNNIKIKVVNNRLAKIAIKDTNLKNISEFLTGPCMIVFYHTNDPGTLFKVLNKILINNKEFKIKKLILNKEVYESSKIKEFSLLPNKKQSLEIFCKVLLLPILTLTLTLKEIPKHLLVMLNNYKISKK